MEKKVKKVKLIFVLFIILLWIVVIFKLYPIIKEFKEGKSGSSKHDVSIKSKPKQENSKEEIFFKNMPIVYTRNIMIFRTFPFMIIYLMMNPMVQMKDFILFR